MFCLAKCCRLCLCKDNTVVEYTCLASDNVSYFQKIMDIAPKLVVDMETYYPTGICKKCQEQVEHMHCFIQECFKSKQILTAYVNKLNHATEDIENPKATNIKTEEHKLTEVPILSPTSNDLFIDNAPIKQHHIDFPEIVQGSGTDVISQNTLLDRREKFDTYIKQEKFDLDDTPQNAEYSFSSVIGAPSYIISENIKPIPYDEEMHFYSNEDNVQSGFEENFKEEPDEEISSIFDNSDEDTRIPATTSNVIENTDQFTSNQAFIRMPSDSGSASPEIREEEQNVQGTLLPEKSKTIYLKVYDIFKHWCVMKKVTEISENVLLVYFEEQAPQKKASSLWATYSMLKSTILLKENIDISKYLKLLEFLKRQNISYKPKRSAIFSKEEILKFLTEAPDEIFLSTKAIFVIGLAGSCTTDELTNMYIKDIDVRDDIIIINIPKSKNGSSRKFVLVEPLWINVLKKYLSMRPSPDMPKVFIGFRNGKPTRQNIGHNTISKVPNTVATFLKLKNCQDYTGHSLRRTSAIILGDCGSDILSLQRHVELKSSSAEDSYIEESIASRRTPEKKQRPSTPPSNLTSILTMSTEYDALKSLTSCSISQPMKEESEVHQTSFNLSVGSISKTSLNINIDIDTATTLNKDNSEINLTCLNSKSTYLKKYSNFKNWCMMKNVTKITENVLLEYFQEQAPIKKASSLWAMYSMLKATILLKENVDISKYLKLIAFLKRQNTSYKPKKSPVFLKEDIIKFLSDAPDEIYLSTKAIFVIGLAGACRTEELINMHIKDIDIRDDLIIINIPKSKNGSPRKFVLVEPLWLEVLKKYLGMRPTPDMPKVFIGFRNGKPTRQNIGHNTISKVPYTVATFLKLKNSQDFTGHSLRRTAATVLAKSGGDILSLK